jgi:Phosphotransferase enzyme family
MTTVVATIEKLTPTWLSGALGIEVVSVEATRIGGGQMAATYRLTLGIADPDGGPRHLVAKLAATEESARAAVADGYRKEVAFYQDLAPTVDIRVPRCHFAAIADDRQTFTLLLEDLGDALAGSHADGGSLRTASEAVQNLAGLHAPRWSDDSLRALRYMRPVTDAGAAYAGRLHLTATEAFVDRFADRLTASDAATLRSAAAVTEAWLLDRSEPFAPIHGDYRLDNLMIHPDGHIVAVDWQGLTLGPPTRDVAFFLGTSLEPEMRSRHEHDLVTGYHNSLVLRGVRGYSAQRCFDDYRVGHLSGTFVTVLGSEYAVSRTPASDLMFLTMAARSCAAIRELGSIELVSGT